MCTYQIIITIFDVLTCKCSMEVV